MTRGEFLAEEERLTQDAIDRENRSADIREKRRELVADRPAFAWLPGDHFFAKQAGITLRRVSL